MIFFFLISHLVISFFMLFCNSSLIHSAPTSIPMAVKDLHVQSLNLSPEITQPTTIISEQDKKKLTLQIDLLTPEQIIPMAYDLCIEHVQAGNYPLSQTDATFLTKMELFKGGEHKKDSLLNKIDHTKTSLGKALLALQLAQPTYDVQTLRHRQELIKTLIEDQDLMQQVEEQLTIMAANEPYVFSYFKPDNAINEELFKKVYFGSWLNSFNTNATALEVATRLGNLINLYTATFIPTTLFEVSVLGKYTAASFKHKADPAQFPPANILNTIKTEVQNIPDYIKAFDPRVKAFKEISLKTLKEQMANPDLSVRDPRYRQLSERCNPQTLGDVLHILDHEASKGPAAAREVQLAKAIYGTVFGVAAAYQIYSAYSSYKDAKLKQDIANYLQTNLIAVASYLHAAQKLYELAQANPILATLPGLQHIKNLFDKNSLISSDLKHLITMLDHNTFTDNASIFSLTGRVLAAHQLMKKVKNELVQTCIAASIFDVYYSIAKLFKTFEHNRVHYSFATYVTDAHIPYVYAKEFWNPGVDTNIVVTNDIELGDNNPNNIILTGPNTGGKSTIIKSVLIDLLLAQTISIAPVDKLIFTPFTVLNCYLNITDDLSAGVSLFKAEVLRAKALIEAIRKLGPSQFSFTIMDEVFSGTSPKEGEEAAFMFAKELATMNNSICSIATHFPKLTELEITKQFKNYQVKVWKDKNNNWIRPFKLEEGKSNINIAMDLLEEAGIFSN